MMMAAIRNSSRRPILVAFLCSGYQFVMMHLPRTTEEEARGAATSVTRDFLADQMGLVDVISRHQVRHCLHWQRAFASQHKDHRYYDVVNDTIHSEFNYLYFAIRNSRGEVRAIQPFFILDQDIMGGVRPYFGGLIDVIRRKWPRFMYMKTMMVGCVAGEAHLDDGDESIRAANAELLAGAITKHARALGAQLMVLKEFPKEYREVLSCFVRGGFTRIPSMPLTQLNIAYSSFEDYMQSALNSATRSKLRKKFRASELDTPIALSVSNNISSIVEEIYPLYLSVYERSKLHFERLTKEYFCRLGKTMPDKVRFFVWRRCGKAVAFGECMVHGDTIFAEYLGLDYNVALKLHLYHYVFRDLVRWGISNGYEWFQSSGLNYDPKLHLRHRLKPVDLYVKHTSIIINMIMRMALPWLEPTRYDKTLKRFPNYFELWDSDFRTGVTSSDLKR
jgi:predicted N-acyltransferase